MLRAEQLALIQGANQQLLQIRELELNYFTNVFENFGIISGLISGFTLSALTQVDALGSNSPDFFKWLFWLTCATTMCTSLHCLLTTTFVNVFGTGLALRGPSGSMVRAVEGMNKEKDAIFMSLIASVLLFQLETLAAGFIVMEQNAAIAASIILVIGTYYWYKYCVRIYQRFKIHKVQFAWKETEEGPSLAGEGGNPMTEVPIQEDNMSYESGSETGTAVVKSKKKSSILQKMMGKDKGRNKEPSDLTVPLAYDAKAETFVNRMEGYLTFKESRGKGIFSSSDNWTRMYFVIEGGDMYYYRKKEDFLLNPSQSIKNRPISLRNFKITSNVRDNGAYEIVLSPQDEDDERKAWSFRCDTAEELQAWGECFARSVRDV